MEAIGTQCSNFTVSKSTQRQKPRYLTDVPEVRPLHRRGYRQGFIGGTHCPSHIAFSTWEHTHRLQLMLHTYGNPRGRGCPFIYPDAKNSANRFVWRRRRLPSSPAPPTSCWGDKPAQETQQHVYILKKTREQATNYMMLLSWQINVLSVHS